MNRCLSISHDWESNLKILFGMMSLLLVFFTLQVPIEARVYDIQASNGEFYAVTLGEDLGVLNFDVRKAHGGGEILIGVTEAERNTAVELYFASNLLRIVRTYYSPDTPVENWEQITRDIVINALNKLTLVQMAEIFAGGAINALDAFADALATGDFSLTTAIIGVLPPAINTGRRLEPERQLIETAGLMAIACGRLVSKHEKVLRDFWWDYETRNYETQVASIPIERINAAWESFYKMTQYQLLASELIHNYLQTTGLKERLKSQLLGTAANKNLLTTIDASDPFITAPVISTIGSAIISTIITNKALDAIETRIQKLKDLAAKTDSEIHGRALSDIEKNRAQSRIALEQAGFFQPSVAEPLPDIRIPESGPQRLDVRDYFSPDSGVLTYIGRSNDLSVVVAQAERSGSSVIIITPKGLGNASVTVELVNFRGLRVTQSFTVIVGRKSQQNQGPEPVDTIPHQSLLVNALSRTVDVAQYFSSQNDLIYEAESNPRGIVTESVSGSRVTIRPRRLGSTSVIVTARDRVNTDLYAIQTIPVLVYTNRATIVRPPSDPTFHFPTPTSLVGLKIGDSVITQLTPGFTLAVRPVAGTNNIPRERIGSGITGTIERGPRSNEGFTWWYIEWDIRGQNLEGWSVEADRGQILFRQPPDLEIQYLNVSEDAVEPGETFKIEVRIRNKGPGESAPTEVYFYYSPNRHSDLEELNADSDNLRVAGSGTLKVPSLQEGRSREVSLSVEAPMTPDRYYYGALLPSNVHETDYKGDLDPDTLHNNLAREERVEVTSSPDLIVESISANRSTLDPGESFRLDVTVRNQGIGEPERNATLRYYRSRDANISKSDREVGDDTISSSNLDTNGTAKRSEGIKAPIEPGVYYYGACVDLRNESNTDNNCSSAVAITVRTPEPDQTPDPVETPDLPDLIVESLRVSDDTLAPGQSFTLYATVRNQKTGASTGTLLRYYRSSDATVSRSDTEVGTDSVSALNADGTETGNINLTAPLAAGTYYYGACVDSVTGEKDTNNNCSQSVTITVQQPAQTEQTAGAIYWTDWDSNKIQRASPNGSNVQDLVTTGLVTPYGIALDVPGGKMYWVDAGTAKIQRANLDGSHIQNLVPLGLGLPICIALDVPGGKMYWTDRGTSKIQRANLDGSNVEDLVFGVKGLHGIALDVPSGKMYWTDNDASKIQRANLDGTTIEGLVTTGLQLPNEIALDIAGGKMYWVDDGTRKIQRANLNGASVQDLVTTGLHTPVGITLDLASGKMYWTDLGTRKIQRADLNGASVQDLVTTGLNAPFGITLGTSLTFAPPVVAREDVNNDGVVDAQDVVLVDQNNLDLNDDGVSDIADVLLVVEAMGNAAGAPAARLQAQHLLTTERVQQWLIEAALLDEDSSTYQRGILVLEQLLALLAPRETVLLLNYPNPFNPETWIPYQIAEPADVTVCIYATNGHLVRTLRLGHQQAGIYHNRSRAAYWDGRNELGEPVASGIYFYTLSAGTFTATRKMLVQK